MNELEVITQKYPYNPHPSQTLFHSSNAKDKAFIGSKGSGKTRTCSVEGTTLSWEFPGNVGVIARKDFPALERSTMTLFIEWLPSQMLHHFDKQKRRLILNTKEKGKYSTIYFVQEKEPKEFDSMNLGWFFIDEGDECPWETFKTLRSRLRIENIPNYGLVASNPPNKRHWIYNYFVVQPRNDQTIHDRMVVRNNTYENMKNLRADYIDDLKRLYVGDELNRFLYGEWGSISNEWQVYSEWRSTLHVSREPLVPIPGIPIIRAWDFGMRAACLWCQMYDGQMRVLQECMEFNKGAEQFVPIALSRQQNKYKDYHFVDLSDPTFVGNRSAVDSTKTCKSVMRDYGIYVENGIADWTKRLRGVNYFLTKTKEGQPCMLVDPSCGVLIGGFEGGYRFKEGADNRRAEDIVKDEYSEVHDCLQHACYYSYKQLVNDIITMYDLPEETYDFASNY